MPVVSQLLFTGKIYTYTVVYKIYFIHFIFFHSFVPVFDLPPYSPYQNTPEIFND